MTDTSLAGQLLHLIHPISTIYFCPSSSSSACLSGHCHQPVPILTASVPENAGIRILFRFRHLGPAMPLPHPCLQHLWVLPLSLQPLPSDLCFQIHGWSPPQEIGRLPQRFIQMSIIFNLQLAARMKGCRGQILEKRCEWQRSSFLGLKSIWFWLNSAVVKPRWCAVWKKSNIPHRMHPLICRVYCRHNNGW